MKRGTSLHSRWYDGLRQRACPVRLLIDGERLLVESEHGDQPTLAYPLARVRWAGPAVRGERQALLPDGSLIRHPDAREWERWWSGQRPGAGARPGWPPSRRGVAIALLIALPVALALFALNR